MKNLRFLIFQLKFCHSFQLTMESNSEEAGQEEITDSEAEQPPARDQWGKGIEFLFSCIALSVGLGNVWRFPFIALENGGGAFLIPYLVVLLLVGRPVYYLEVIIGQFSSRGCIGALNMAPIMKGELLSTFYRVCASRLTCFMLQAWPMDRSIPQSWQPPTMPASWR